MSLPETDEQREARIEQAEADALDEIAAGSDAVLEFVQDALEIDVSPEVDAFLRYAILNTQEPNGLSNAQRAARRKHNDSAYEIIDTILARYVAAQRDRAEHETDEDRRAEADAERCDDRCSERGSS